VTEAPAAQLSVSDPATRHLLVGPRERFVCREVYDYGDVLHDLQLNAWVLAYRRAAGISSSRGKERRTSSRRPRHGPDRECSASAATGPPNGFAIRARDSCAPTPSLRWRAPMATALASCSSSSTERGALTRTTRSSGATAPSCLPVVATHELREPRSVLRHVHLPGRSPARSIPGRCRPRADGPALASVGRTLTRRCTSGASECCSLVSAKQRSGSDGSCAGEAVPTV
jgi:hypothetical protein